MLKRIFDILLSAIGLFFSSPLWILISVLVLLEDGRPLFFRQERVGKLGRKFKALKFRTMKHHPDKPHLDLDLDIKNDLRLTSTGKILRATAMDELPQLLNILKGDMSFVGPRSLPLWIDDDREGVKYKDITEIPGFEERSRVKPGLTGIAQIYAPKDASREEKFKYDIEYVNKMNFWLDLKLIFLSFRITLRGAWEKRKNKL